MKIYIIYATEMEVATAKQYCTEKLLLTTKDNLQNIGYCVGEDIEIYFACHGVGVLHASYYITQLCISSKPDFILQAGIAGCYHTQHALGNVYTVSADRLADLGAQDHENFMSAQDLDLQNPNTKPYLNGWLFNTELPYPVFFRGFTPLSSITVNTASGNQKTIDCWQKLYKPSLETMEGAALHYACLKEKISFVQLRAASNYVTPRDKSSWQIPLAIQNLNDVLVSYIKTLE